MKKIYIFLISCVTVLSAVAQTTPNLYRAVDKAKMNHWVDSVFDAISDDERVGQLFMVIANPKSDTRNMQRLMRYVNEMKIANSRFSLYEKVLCGLRKFHMEKPKIIPKNRIIVIHFSFFCIVLSSSPIKNGNTGTGYRLR